MLDKSQVWEPETKRHGSFIRPSLMGRRRKTPYLVTHYLYPFSALERNLIELDIEQLLYEMMNYIVLFDSICAGTSGVVQNLPIRTCCAITWEFNFKSFWIGPETRLLLVSPRIGCRFGWQCIEM
jgi:hypothetical protein